MKNGNRKEMLRDFGNVIRTMRKRAKLTQQNVADAIGVSQSAYSKVETGKAELAVFEYLALSHVLDGWGDELLLFEVEFDERFGKRRRRK